MKVLSSEFSVLNSTQRRGGAEETQNSKPETQNFFSNPLDIHAHARAMMIEQIMAVIGRGSKDPARYRRVLEGFESKTLAALLDKIHERILEGELRRQESEDRSQNSEFLKVGGMQGEPRKVDGGTTHG